MLQIFMFREKIYWCKKPFGNHISIIFTLKKDFFTFNKVKKKAIVNTNNTEWCMFYCDKPNKCENSDSEWKKMASREFGQHQLCDSVLETGTKHNSVFDQITKFIEFWKNGQKASFKIESENGEAWICQLI